MFLSLDVSYSSDTPQVKLVEFLNVMTVQGPLFTTTTTTTTTNTAAAAATITTTMRVVP